MALADDFQAIVDSLSDDWTDLELEPAVHATLTMLDSAGIEGEIALRDVRIGRAPVTQMWGRPESARREFKRIHAQ
jgi:hypothetical protein